MKLILGSGSPRRKSILESIFGPVHVVSPSVDESMKSGENAEEYTQRITNLKMDAVLRGLNQDENFCVITSDTVVAIDDRILGKPLSEAEACSMLKLLSGREHSVMTGLCIFLKNGNDTNRIYGCEKTSVKFKKLDDGIIKKYLNLVDYHDKAGSYAVQNHGELIVDSIDGSMTNVIGFPLRLFYRMITDNRASKFLENKN